MAQVPFDCITPPLKEGLHTTCQLPLAMIHFLFPPANSTHPSWSSVTKRKSWGPRDEASSTQPGCLCTSCLNKPQNLTERYQLSLLTQVFCFGLCVCWMFGAFICFFCVYAEKPNAGRAHLGTEKASTTNRNDID